MRKSISLVINNKIFKLLIITIFLLISLQTIIVSYYISNQSNPNGKHRNYEFIYQENINIIKLLLSEKQNINSISFKLEHSNATSSYTHSPICKTQVNDFNTRILYQKIHNTYAFEYCISFKIKDNYWLNYIITPTIGIERIVIFLSAITLLIILVTAIFCWILLKVLLPIKKFQNSAYALGMSLEEKDIQPTGIKILHGMSYSLNFVQKKLFNALRIRTKMLSMITHDLKSPITRLKLRYEFGIIENSKNLQDIKLLEELTNQILLDIRNDVFEYETIEEINIKTLLANISKNYSNIIIKSDYKEIIKGRKKSLFRAFDNLISNAKKYSEEVLISVYKESSYITISIKDYGCGIEESELKNIFKPFYQPKGSKKGYGLGLTIAQEIILNHGGTIDIINHHNPHGVIVNVKLPY